MLFNIYRAPRRRRFNPFSSRFYQSLYGYCLNGVVQALAKPSAADYLDHKLNDTVGYGEFAGMNFRAARGLSNQYYSKLLGTYERELTPLWHEIRSNKYDLVVNIGASDGYYAVGFAINRPRTKVIAFEADGRYTSVIRDLANDNGAVVDVRGFCTRRDLALCIDVAERPLALIDVEGFEYDLLEPWNTPKLTRCDILLETHNFLSIPRSAEMVTRFQSTHEIRVIKAKRRRLADLPFKPLHSLPLRMDLLSLLQEHRSYPQEWLWMKVRN